MRLPPFHTSLCQRGQSNHSWDRKGQEGLGSGTPHSPATPKCLKKAGRRVKMGSTQEAAKKPSDLGVGEDAEEPAPGAALRRGELELKEEWQDEEFPGLLPEEPRPSEEPEDAQRDSQAATPSTLALCGQRPMRKRLSAPELKLNLLDGRGDEGASPTHSAASSSEGSSDLDVDELETPSDSEQLDSGHEFEWEDDLPRAEGLGASDAAQQLGRGCTWDVAGGNGHRWRVFRIGPREQRVDMTVIEPYKKVLSHGGYHGDGLNAVILFASCYLPQSSIPNYTYVMEHLFRYMVGTLELLVAENYLLVHLSGGTSRAQVPPLSWIRQCYRALERRSKFTRKIRFLDSLGELGRLISLDQLHIPDAVRQLDLDLHGSGGMAKRP
ncbi:PREDICTED: bcl-2/adenovirus E1B 19 kDa-interacting protein 2-like protein isoform X2 [Chinchilla lanigera]|uniref:bcl-2/adenovirus E1B 19 kDa-interacting protein 2-like protein isoform X2 n=1 Tax=Chinchilla lanigera TaxID=34839 RepID=UPI00038EE5A1|nr:PREDICTED: bcl-2/adenovirus E1B 19 kDa-interacting protein 2-like protein isoform X2 [Chinchilla lanigera]